MIIIHDVARSNYLPRALAGVVEAALRGHPVVVVSGGRQTGKTTLVQHIARAERRTFRSLDDLDVLELARKRPEDLLVQGRQLTIDEVQRAPDLLLAIKRDVDRNRQRARFLLTGSANLLLMREVADSLAGRAVHLDLGPMTSGEKHGTGEVPAWSRFVAARSAEQAEKLAAQHAQAGSPWHKEALKGGLPPAALAGTQKQRTQWFDGFVGTYLERDLRDLSQVSSLPDFRRLMRLAAQRIGNLLNQTHLGRDAGLAQATAHRYLNLMETTFQIVRLAPYAVNPSKRLIRSPKLYFSDVGLAAHLAGISSTQQLSASGLRGALLENLVLTGLLAWRQTVHPRPEVLYFRTAGGAEVDFVIETRSRLLPIEVKAARNLQLRDLRHLELFLDDYRAKAPWGLVLYGGDQPRRLTRRIVAVPVDRMV